MIRLLTTPLVLHFWASPHNPIAELANWGEVRAERNALKVLDPGFSHDDSPETPPSPSPRLPEFPTDVPAPEPHDVPVPEPIDVPPPDPGKVPAEPQPPKRPGQDPKPRPVP
jgi:hypothetical protein